MKIYNQKPISEIIAARQQQSQKDETISQLITENAVLKAENAYLKARDTLLQDDVTFIFETLANNGMV
ncbi:MAG TPA: hypothetical protein VE710_18465 [Candidatus Bathyarchaeia archaeon]|nr:hypothetical protein [Candidatus Bathyarchaeia archaeon]